MNNKIILGLLGIIVLAGGVYAVNSSEESDRITGKEAMEKDKMMEVVAADDMVKKDEAVAAKEADLANAMMDKDMENKDDMMTAGSYVAYAPEKLAMAEDGKVVLFFKASWCPSCRAVDVDIKASLSDIPEGVTILEVDYDASTELKKKYGVTSQHTFVQVDAQGNELSQWSGSPTLESIVEKLK